MSARIHQHSLISQKSCHTEVAGTPAIAAHRTLYAVALEPIPQKNPSGAPAAFGVSLAALGPLTKRTQQETIINRKGRSTYPSKKSVQTTEATPVSTP